MRMFSVFWDSFEHDQCTILRLSLQYQNPLNSLSKHSQFPINGSDDHFIVVLLFPVPMDKTWPEFVGILAKYTPKGWN